LEALNVNPVTFLNGARQTGKSTLVQQNLDQTGTTEAPAVYVSFDHPTQMAAAAKRP